MGKPRKGWSDKQLRDTFDKRCSGQDKCKDKYGKQMCFQEYGNRNSSCGWEMDHIDGNPNNNDLNNIQALNWESNLEKG